MHFVGQVTVSERDEVVAQHLGRDNSVVYLFWVPDGSADVFQLFQQSMDEQTIEQYENDVLFSD